MKQPRRIFSRYHLILIFTCLAIVLALVSLSMMISAVRQSEELRSQQHEYQQSALKQAVTSADERFSLSRSLMTQFWNNASSDILPYLVEDDQSNYRIFRIMRALRISQDYFSYLGFQFAIIDPTNQRFISNSKYTSLQTALDEMYFPRDLAPEVTALGEAENLNKILYYTNGKGGFLIFKAWSNATPGNVFIECYHFDMNTLQIDMTGLLGCSFYIYHDTDIMFSSKSPESPDLNELFPDMEGYLPIKTGRMALENYQADVVNSRYFNMKYLLISPAFSSAPLSVLHYNPAATTVIFLCLGLGIAYAAAYMLYRPVRRTLKNIRTLSPGHASGDGLLMNEFDVIENTLNDMHSTIEDLQSIVLKNQPSLQEKALRDLLLGLVVMEDIPAMVLDLDLPVKSGALSITLIEVRGHDDLSISLLAKINPKINEILNAHLQAYACHGLTPVLQVMSLRRFCILSSQTDVESLRPLAATITRELESSTGFETTSAITLALKPEDIPDAYDRAFVLIRSAQNRGFSVHTEDAQAVFIPSFTYQAETERELMRAVLDCDVSTATTLITRVFAHSIEAQVPAEQLGWALYTTVQRIMQRSGAGTELAAAIQEACEKDMMTLKDVAVAGFAALAQSVAVRAAASSQDFSKDMLHYLDENYASDLSLLQVADHFRFSAVYMSTLFKNVTGTNFKDYLTMLRVRHAKELLAQNYRVYEVAGMVGCNTADTFIRMFKRVEGISPGKYQQEQLSKNNGESKS